MWRIKKQEVRIPKYLPRKECACPGTINITHILHFSLVSEAMPLRQNYSQ